jgi:hypothetical protein
MKKLIFLILVLITSGYCSSQSVLLEKDVKSDSILPKFGKNYKSYYHLFLGFGTATGLPDSTGSNIKYGLSNNIVVGFRYKLRVCNLYSLGFEIAYNNYGFNLKQDSSKVLPNKLLHDKEMLNFNNLGLGIYNRFNLGKRGNRIGNYIDIGAYGDWICSVKHFMKDEQSNGNIIKTTISHLNYYETFMYGVSASIGFNWFALTAKYRISDVFVKSYNYPELPRLTVGIQLGLLTN